MSVSWGERDEWCIMVRTWKNFYFRNSWKICFSVGTLSVINFSSINFIYLKSKSFHEFFKPPMTKFEKEDFEQSMNNKTRYFVCYYWKQWKLGKTYYIIWRILYMSKNELCENFHYKALKLVVVAGVYCDSLFVLKK